MIPYIAVGVALAFFILWATAAAKVSKLKILNSNRGLEIRDAERDRDRAERDKNMFIEQRVRAQDALSLTGAREFALRRALRELAAADIGMAKFALTTVYGDEDEHR